MDFICTICWWDSRLFCYPSWLSKSAYLNARSTESPVTPFSSPFCMCEMKPQQAPIFKCCVLDIRFGKKKEKRWSLNLCYAEVQVRFLFVRLVFAFPRLLPHLFVLEQLLWSALLLGFTCAICWTVLPVFKRRGAVPLQWILTVCTNKDWFFWWIHISNTYQGSSLQFKLLIIVGIADFFFLIWL